MNEKFELAVFVEKEKDTFSEFSSLEELENDFGAEHKEKVVGYFPPKSNVTFEELKQMKENQHWTVAYHRMDKKSDVVSYMELVHFNSTIELRRKIDTIIQETYQKNEEYVTLYKSEDIIYL